MLLLGGSAWAAALAAGALGWWALGGVVVAALGLAVLVRPMARRAGPGAARTASAVLLVLGGVAVVATVRVDQVATGPVAQLARDGAAVRIVGTVTADPRRSEGRFGDMAIVRLELREVTGRGERYAVVAPVLVLADDDWAEVPLGATVRGSGRLAPADGGDLAAVLSARGPPEVVHDPDVWWDAAAAVRAAIRDAVAHRPATQRALVPALVDGDDAAVDDALAEDFRTTGLTHLLAVSGTNLTLVVGFLLVLARWCGMRGRALYAVGAVGIVGFVLLARTEPSVLRAAVMGAVALFAMGPEGRERGSRALGVAVLVLLLVQPGLAGSPGFALSVLATAGILLLAPGWRDALGRWLPRWLAEAIAVPAAAQLACTPVVAALSGQVSLVAVVANLAAAPVVGPATYTELWFRPSEVGQTVAVAYEVNGPNGRELVSGEMHVIPTQSNRTDTVSGAARHGIVLRRPNVAVDGNASAPRPLIHTIQGRSLQIRVTFDEDIPGMPVAPTVTTPVPGVDYLTAERLVELSTYVRRGR